LGRSGGRKSLCQGGRGLRLKANSEDAAVSSRLSLTNQSLDPEEFRNYEIGAKWDWLPSLSFTTALYQLKNPSTPTSNVTLGSYTRVDAAVYFRLNERIRAQANVENLFGEEYYVFANSNTNITPGSPRALRASLVYNF
jgi:outer membrane receptor protein involved in Fe transport